MPSKRKLKRAIKNWRGCSELISERLVEAYAVEDELRLELHLARLTELGTNNALEQLQSDNEVLETMVKRLADMVGQQTPAGVRTRVNLTQLREIVTAELDRDKEDE